MKLESRGIEAFLRDPGDTRVVLLFGDDVGLIMERARRLTQVVAGAADDPFRVTELDSDSVSRIAVEIASPPLTGGRRVVRARDIRDGQLAGIEAALDPGSTGFLVIEAPTLPTRSKLRAMIERAPAGMAIGCYRPDASTLGTDIRRQMERFGVTVTHDAMQWLQDRLGADDGVTRGELDKLALYTGPGNTVDILSAQACVGDIAALSIEDALFSATAGDISATDRALSIALSEGVAPVAVIRACLLHLQRLMRTQFAVLSGGGAADPVANARPPVFFRRQPAFRRALTLWTTTELQAACSRLSEREQASKRTGSPAETICRSAIFAIARQSAAAARRAQLVLH